MDIKLQLLEAKALYTFICECILFIKMFYNIKMKFDPSKMENESKYL